MPCLEFPRADRETIPTVQVQIFNGQGMRVLVEVSASLWNLYQEVAEITGDDAADHLARVTNATIYSASRSSDKAARKRSRSRTKAVQNPTQ